MSIPDTAELIETIRAACELASKWEPQHKQYIEGRFYLTPDQWAAIREEWPERPGFNDGYALWGIPVHIIKPNDRVRLPSGNWLVYSRLLESLYIFDSSIATLAGLTS